MKDAFMSGDSFMHELNQAEIEAVAGGFEFWGSVINHFTNEGSGGLGTFKFVTGAMWAETLSWLGSDGSSGAGSGTGGAGVRG